MLYQHNRVVQRILFDHSKKVICLLFCIIFCLTSCENFVEVDSPRNLLDTKKVFENSATVESAFANIYTNLRDQGILSAPLGLNTLIGVYVDELEYHQSDLSISEFEQHTINSNNRRIRTWWSQAYNGIYATNDIIEGLENSNTITEADKDPLIGRALFIRAYLHSLLVNLFGDIPYITTTDYLENNEVTKEDISTVYSLIIADLNEAIERLAPRDPGVERVVPDQTTAQALLARVYLYTDSWEAAAELATQVIQTAGYELESDPVKVFLKESSEAIWQFKPDLINNWNSDIANTFLIKSPSTVRYTITSNLIDTFESGDLRKEHWIGKLLDSDTGNIFYFSSKYKEDFNTKESLEYSILFRLSEQYLIRAEAEAQLGQVDKAQKDLNIIRNRAGLPDTGAQTQAALLEAILQERRVELFTEYGQRWFDLKRTGKAREILSPLKPNWAITDLLLPLPEDELELNPNLRPQNGGIN